MIKGLVFALVTGFFGGLSPALRASREKTAGILRGM
jgi:ABC-type antimicrobial peptide transport system permease subunit